MSIMCFQPHAGDKLLVTTKGAAEILDLPVALIQRMVRTGRMPQPLRVGRKWLWRVSDLKQWAEDGCPPVSEWNARQYRQKKRMELQALERRRVVPAGAE